MTEVKLSKKQIANMCAAHGIPDKLLDIVKEEWAEMRERGVCYRNDNYECPNDYACQEKLEGQFANDVKMAASYRTARRKRKHPFSRFKPPFVTMNCTGYTVPINDKKP
jgi:hypothetical protein